MPAIQSAFVAQWDRLLRSAPENPFLTIEYASARERMGEALVMLEQGAQVCPAFLKRGRITAVLDIPSLPFEPSNAFLSSLVDFCRDQRIYETTLNTFASPALSIPRLPRETARRGRTEFLLDLTVPPDQWKIGETHRRHVRRAQKSAIGIRRIRVEGLQDHVSLCRASMSRREERGETVPTITDNPEAASLVLSGAAELFQAMESGKVLSSMLVIKARCGAYYHSAGTSQEGMAVGASHFLVHSAARMLQEEGMKIFNLGGADASLEGLRAFKARFGTVPVETEAVRAVLCGSAHRIFVDACHALKRLRSR